MSREGELALPIDRVVFAVFVFFSLIGFARGEAPKLGVVKSYGCKVGDPDLRVVKQDSRGASGYCLATVDSDSEALSVLARNGVRVKAKNRQQLYSLAAGIQQIELIAGTRWPYINGAYVTFPKDNYYSEQRSHAICMGQNHRDGNVAHLMHELGHYVGNRGMYEKYESHMGRSGCYPSRYADNNRHEEFAEVFAAFVTHPELLKNSKSRSCRKAFIFLSSQVAHPEFAICNRAYLNGILRQKAVTSSGQRSAS